jgi:hypothetical protein
MARSSCRNGADGDATPRRSRRPSVASARAQSGYSRPTSIFGTRSQSPRQPTSQSSAACARRRGSGATITPQTGEGGQFSDEAQRPDHKKGATSGTRRRFGSRSVRPSKRCATSSRGSRASMLAAVRWARAHGPRPMSRHDPRLGRADSRRWATPEQCSGRCYLSTEKDRNRPKPPATRALWKARCRKGFAQSTASMLTARNHGPAA